MVTETRSKGAFQHVESEYYNYHDTKKDILRIRNDIILSSSPQDITGIRGNLPSDSTGRIAGLLVSNIMLEQMNKVIEAIESVTGRLPQEKKELIRLKYWTRPQTLTWDGIAIKLNVSRRQAINWRDEIIYITQDILGWR